MPLLVLFRQSESCLQAAPVVYKSVSGKQFHFQTSLMPIVLSLLCPMRALQPAHPLISLSASNALFPDGSCIVDISLCDVNAECDRCTARIY